MSADNDADTPHADHSGDEDQEQQEHSQSSPTVSALKLLAASALLFSAASTYTSRPASSVLDDRTTNSAQHRRLTDDVGTPTYLSGLLDDLKERKKLMEETPPEEVKYWFEYTGPLQKYYYRYSKSRGKADSFEGRDDSGVTSARFVEEPGGGPEFETFHNPSDPVPEGEASARSRLLENCLAMGSPSRPDTGKGSLWNEWFGGGSSQPVPDRCRILFTLNTVGAGRGTTMLWETNPPAIHAEGPKPWISEQETAATHLERSLQEVDAMCATGQVAARVQVLVCEPIPGKWTDWMDSMLVNCGGRPAPVDGKKGGDADEVEERPSPVQVVVVASASTADSCHDLKSGFMEKRMQDLVLAPPYLTKDGDDGHGRKLAEGVDPAVKMTHPDLVSSDDHDLYVALKWSSMVTVRAVNAFLQASADLAAAAASPNNQKAAELETNADGITVALTGTPSSPFLVPSFVRVSYVSEENNKVAKWRMHGDFFHPAAWEVCKDSYDMAWIPDSLSGPGGVNGLCQKELKEEEDCGQWWIYMAEEQMPTTPEVYANEVTAPLVQGGSNYVWMITERQRREIVRQKTCRVTAGEKEDEAKKCGEAPQAVIPLGDLESFLINFTPNTALGKKHNKGRRPGYSKEEQHELDREKVRERKQLKGQEDIEKALFDYTIYPAALFRKDATVKAARARDGILTSSDKAKDDTGAPRTVKSSYYDVTITKPREAVSGWCQAVARKGLCVLYADYFRTGADKRCREACGMKKNWTKMQK